MSGETRKEYTRWRTHAVLLFLFFPSFLSSFSYRNDSSLLMAIRFVFSLNFQPDNLDWYCRIRKKLERSISRRTKYTLELGFLKFTFKDIWDWDKWMIPFWSCFKIVHIPFTLQFSFKNILIFHRILKTKKKKNFWRIQDLQFNLIKRIAYMYIHFWSPVASCEHGTIVNRGRDVGGTTYFSPFSTCVERERAVSERDDTRT